MVNFYSYLVVRLVVVEEIKGATLVARDPHDGYVGPVLRMG